MVKFLSAFVLVVLPVTVGAQTIDSSWLQADSVTKTAAFQLVAGLTGLNGALREIGRAHA